MSSSEHNYYRHSGKLNFFGIILSVFGTCIAALIAGPLMAVFKLIGTYFIDVGFFGVLLAGWGVGNAVGSVIKLTKIRNEGYSFGVGLVAGLILVLSTWFCFYVLLQSGDVQAKTGFANGMYFPWEAPGRFFSIIDAYAFEEGKRGQFLALLVLTAFITKIFVFYYEFSNISGFWLYGLWSIEAFWLIGFTAYTCKSKAGKHGFVFCETCNQEASILFQSPLLVKMPNAYGPEMANFRHKLEQGKVKELTSLPVASDPKKAGHYSRMILRGCHKCHDFYCADIATVEVKWDEAYSEEIGTEIIQDDENLLIEHLLITHKQYVQLNSHFKKAEMTVSSN
ncbi:MAG: hypothetical protein V7750_09930 [Sneathiella sp.]